MSWFRPDSIRTRLAGGYAFAVALAELFFAWIVLAQFRASSLEKLDERLHDDYEAIEHQFEKSNDGGIRWIASYREPDERSPEMAWAEISRRGGPVLLKRPAVPVYAQDSRTQTYSHALGPDEYVVRVGRSPGLVEGEIGRLQRIVFQGGVLVAVAAFVFGLILARRALKPVETMTTRAKAITAERLGERLPVENAQDELGRLASIMNAMLARLEQQFEQLRRFTADASHELRTPLTAMRSVGEVGLRERRGEEAAREVIGSMLEETDRLTQLVDGLLTLSRSDAGRLTLSKKPTDLAALARDVAQRLGVLAEEKHQTLEVRAETPLTREVDPLLLRQALTNLVDNAIKYGPANSKVTVDVGERDGAAIISVTDEGPGIPVEHQPRLFDRFYRVDPSRPRGGVGLGLAIAKSIVDAHGGRIDLESAESRGSTIRITLPGA